MGLPIEDRVRCFLLQHDLTHLPEPLLVGVSGGPDSVCLLHVLARLAPELGLKLHAVHLDHGLRGREAKADARYVKRLCRRLGVPVSAEQRQVEAYRRQHRLSLEEAARQVRHAVFAQAAERLATAAVALGHTADDQVETVLMHLLRGAGPTGLKGMEDRSEIRVGPTRITLLRPILEVRRRETEAYCQSHRLRPREDLTNRSPKFLRNRVRHQLLPVLRRYNSSFDDGLLRLAHLMEDEVAYLDQEAQEALAGLALPEEYGFILALGPLVLLPVALQRAMLRAAIRQVKGNLAGIEAHHIESVRVMLTPSQSSSKQLSLPEGLVAERLYGRLWIGKGRPPIPWPELPTCEQRLTIPGETVLSSGWRVQATVQDLPGEGEGLTASLDFQETGADLLVRSWRPGDRFQPLGMRRAKKLQDFFVDQKVPRAWRPRTPLVCGSGGVVWVVGYRPAEQFKVSPSTQQVLVLTFHPS